MQVFGLVILIIVAVVASISKGAVKANTHARREPVAPERQTVNPTFRNDREFTVPQASYAPTVHPASFTYPTETPSSVTQKKTTPPRTQIVHSEVVAAKPKLQSSLNLSDAARAIVVGDILGKPKALRR
ncbi:MAG: hypothetical protein PHT58_06370 [Eubacteriales bacterium]|nr:hypothetical protein [Eubacteriales bacterium]